MPHVTLNGFIRVSAADLEAVLEELPTHIALTRAEIGCLLFNVEQDSRDPAVFHVNEEFVDATSFKAHQERVRSSRWGAVSVAAERHYQVTGLE